MPWQNYHDDVWSAQTVFNKSFAKTVTGAMTTFRFTGYLMNNSAFGTGRSHARPPHDLNLTEKTAI